MRISDTVVMQFIASTPPTVVIASDIDGSEIILDKDALIMSKIAADYFLNHML